MRPLSWRWPWPECELCLEYSSDFYDASHIRNYCMTYCLPSLCRHKSIAIPGILTSTHFCNHGIFEHLWSIFFNISVKMTKKIAKKLRSCNWENISWSYFTCMYNTEIMIHYAGPTCFFNEEEQKYVFLWENTSPIRVQLLESYAIIRVLKIAKRGCQEGAIQVDKNLQPETFRLGLLLGSEGIDPPFRTN